MVGSKRKMYKKTKSASLKSVNVKIPLNITLRVGYRQINARSQMSMIYSGNQCFRVIMIIIHAKYFIEDNYYA